MSNGLLIAIEGIDGSGKGSQAKMLKSALTLEGFSVDLFAFPQYETSFFGREVGKFLHGDYGQLSDVNPKFSALLFALDRYESKDRIIESISLGRVVICDRYAASNIAHQGARAMADERGNLSNWIEQVEFNILKLPRPDLVIFLDTTVETSQELVLRKSPRSYTNQAHDLQERSPDHLQLALNGFREMAKVGHWKTINCLDDTNKMRSYLSIHEEILSHVRTVQCGR